RRVFPPGPRLVNLEELLRPRERRDGAHDRLPRPGLGDRLRRVPARHGPRERAACGGLVIRRGPPPSSGSDSVLSMRIMASEGLNPVNLTTGCGRCPAPAPPDRVARLPYGR